MRYICLHFKIWHVFTGFCTVLCALVLLLLLFYRHPTQQRPIQNTSNLYLIFKKQETKSADNVNIDTSAISYLPIFNFFFFITLGAAGRKSKLIFGIHPILKSSGLAQKQQERLVPHTAHTVC